MTPEQIAGNRQEFEAWMKTREGWPFAGQYASLMWAAWQAAIAHLRATPQTDLYRAAKAVIDYCDAYPPMAESLWCVKQLREAMSAAPQPAAPAVGTIPDAATKARRELSKTIMEALATIARLPTVWDKKSDSEAIFREPVVIQVMRIRTALDKFNAAPSQPAERVKCAHCGRSPGDKECCDWIECAAIATAPRSNAQENTEIGEPDAYLYRFAGPWDIAFKAPEWATKVVPVWFTQPQANAQEHDWQECQRICDLPPLPEYAAQMFPDDLERFKFGEHTAAAFSIEVGRVATDGVKSAPLYTADQMREYGRLSRTSDRDALAAQFRAELDKVSQRNYELRMENSRLKIESDRDAIRDAALTDVATSILHAFSPDDRLDPKYIADCILSHTSVRALKSAGKGNQS